MPVFIAFDVIGAGLDRRFHDLVFRTRGRRIKDLADAIEHEADRVGFTQRAAIL